MAVSEVQARATWPSSAGLPMHKPFPHDPFVLYALGAVALFIGFAAFVGWWVIANA